MVSFFNLIVYEVAIYYKYTNILTYTNISVFLKLLILVVLIDFFFFFFFDALL